MAERPKSVSPQDGQPEQSTVDEKRSASLEKARIVKREMRVEELRESRDPKDNAAKVKAIQDGTMHSADLYRTIMSGPSGQKSHVFVGRVRYTPDRQQGEFEVIDANSGERAGWMTRTVRNGEQMYVLHSENYDGEIRLVGWTDTVSYGADVLVNGSSRASTRGTLDARRLSGGKFEAYVPKSLDEINQEMEVQERAATEQRRQRDALDTSRVKPDDGAMTTTAAPSEPTIGVKTSSRGRTTTVTLPDGTVAERTSKTRDYTHAVVATRDMHQRAQILQAETDRRQAFVEALQAWVDRGANTDELKAYPSGSLSYNEKQAGKSPSEYYLPGFEPVRESVRGGRDYWADHFGFSLPNFKDTERTTHYDSARKPDGPAMTPWERYGPSHVLDRQRTHIESNRKRITELNAGPRFVYEVIRWSGDRANAQKAATSEFASPGTTYRVIGVGDDLTGQTADESKPVKTGPTAEEKAAAKTAKAETAKATNAARRAEFIERTTKGIREASNDENALSWLSLTDAGLRALARDVAGIKQAPRGMSDREKKDFYKHRIIKAIRG